MANPDADAEFDPRLLDDDGEPMERINWNVSVRAANRALRLAYPEDQYPTVDSLQSLLDRALEDVALQSEHGGQPPQIARNIVQTVKDCGGVSVIVAGDGDEFVLRTSSGAMRARVGHDEKRDLEHMAFEEIDREEFVETVAEEADEGALEALLGDLVEHPDVDVSDLEDVLADLDS